mgnify:CR=1 FL=1
MRDKIRCLDCKVEEEIPVIEDELEALDKITKFLERHNGHRIEYISILNISLR